MIDSARIEAARMVDRYLADELSPEEAAAFEEHLLESPEAQAEVETVRRLKLGLATLREKRELEALVAGNRVLTGGPLYALAASVLILFGIASFSLTDRGPLLLAESADAFAPEARVVAPTEVLVMRMRDSSYPRVELPQGGQLVELRIDTEAHLGAATFDVQIARDGVNEPLARLENLRTAEEGVLKVYFDARASGPGDYRVRLEPKNAKGEALEPEEFPLTIRS
jgi:hypothetical protein